MEDMARLALVEQSVGNQDLFNKILHELLRHINTILENPHDYDIRIIKGEVLKSASEHDAFTDYLKSVGFLMVGTGYTYPKEQTLSNLRVAQAALERKIYFCCGAINMNAIRSKSSQSLGTEHKTKLQPCSVLTTTNPFLLQVQKLFNEVLKYEDRELQELAREHIPIVTLQLLALDRMREHQRKLKAGEIKGQDMPFDTALLMELVGWFKYKFFSWVDKPPCELCGGGTVSVETQHRTIGDETCRVEIYKCVRCRSGGAVFARHNSPRALLRSRRGRCGEWANCFALFARALGYDTRYVYDTTDHVWCEVFDYDARSWVHVDPCEARVDTPLMYSAGWGKALSYVVAVSRDDLQDVTWRYTTDHKQVLARRTLCPESELVGAILLLRERRQAGVTPARRRCLAQRAANELVQLMTERKPGESEWYGRVSGSAAWRAARGEGARAHVFAFRAPGQHALAYTATDDAYTITADNGSSQRVAGWAAGVFHCKAVFRKLEHDWRMVYLAREEGESYGSISWKLAAEGDLEIASISIKVVTKLYENGHIAWTLAFDDAEPIPVKLCETATVLTPCCRRIVVSAMLSGGSGEAAWQHAQLFRQPVEPAAAAAAAARPAMQIGIVVREADRR